MDTPDACPADAEPPDGVVFAFAGQASQYPGMGRRLAAGSPRFAAEWHRIASRLWADLPGGLDCDLPATDVRRTHREIFAVQWALSRTLLAAGIEPDVVVGISMGELCAATLAGAIAEEDAIELVITQAQQIHRRCSSGGMVAVLGRPDALESIRPEPQCAVGLVSRHHFVLGGDRAGLDRMCRQLRDCRIKSFVLPVERGFHSPAIDAAVTELREFGSYRPATGGITLASSTMGDVALSRPADDHMWSAIRNPIRFVDAARKLHGGRRLTWLDLGPGSSVSTLLSHNRIPVTGVQTLLASPSSERLPAG